MNPDYRPTWLCGRRYASFNASSELPGGVEEAVMFWVNKSCTALAHRGDLDIIQGESNQKVRSHSPATDTHSPATDTHSPATDTTLTRHRYNT